MNKLAAYIILLFIVFGCNDAPKFDIKNFPKEQPSPGDIIEHSVFHLKIKIILKHLS